MAGVHVKKNDTVIVLTGSPIEREPSGRLAPKRGRVIEVRPKEGKVLVEGFKMVKRHMRPNRPRGVAGGIMERESYIDISNIMVVCPACNRPTRIKWDAAGDKKTRLCQRCGGNIDQ
jgi:large subunit ribosomal protein L24